MNERQCSKYTKRIDELITKINNITEERNYWKRKCEELENKSTTMLYGIHG